MMSSASPSTIGDLTTLLARLRADEAALMEEYEERLATLRQRIAAVQLTLDLFVNVPQIGPTDATGYRPIQAPGVNGWRSKLAGLTQPQALARIAEENGGRLRITEAKRILIAAGHVKGSHKNVSSHIYHLLGNSDRWRKEEPGLFRLVPAGTPWDDEANEEPPTEDRAVALAFA